MADDEPLFKKVLGPRWTELSDVIRKHYFLRAGSVDAVCVTGTMGEVDHTPIARLLIPFGLLFGSVVPWRGRDIPVEVHYNARADDRAIYWHRVFRFPNHRPFHFRSHMAQVRGNEVIEFIRFGVGARLVVTAENGGLVFRDRGYVWRIGPLTLPLPGRLVFGRVYVEEMPIDERRFAMKLEIAHPLLGRLFSYNGEFKLPE